MCLFSRFTVKPPNQLSTVWYLTYRHVYDTVVGYEKYQGSRCYYRRVVGSLGSLYRFGGVVYVQNGDYHLQTGEGNFDSDGSILIPIWSLKP